ncbi:hypothetical protein ACOJK1_005342 [Pseudomonas aeruginosa]
MSSTQHQLIEQCATRLRGIVDALDNIHDTSPHRWSTDLDDVHSSAESLLALIKDQAPAPCIDCKGTGFCNSISGEEIRCPCHAPIQFADPAQTPVEQFEQAPPSEDQLTAAGLSYPLAKEDAVKLWYAGFRSEVVTVLEAWEAIGHDIGMNPSKGELLDSLRNMAAICDAHGNDMPAQSAIDQRQVIADAITGALAFGAQASQPPAEDHWLRPFYDIGRAEGQRTQELAMLVRMLASSLKRHAPESNLMARATNYLAAKGLAGTPLRDAPASVEQAGGDERAAFEAAFAAMGRPVCRADYDQDAYGTPFDDGGWTGWQARAALAQPSPVRSSLLINGYQLRAALDFIAPDGTAEQLKSEACIEWRQQDADFLEAGLYAFCAEYPEEGGVLLDEEPTTAQPSPLQSDQAEAERPALWAVHAQGPDELYAAFSREDAEKHAAELNALPMPEGIAVGAVVVPSPWPAVQHWQYLAEQEQDHKNEIAGRLRQLERICEGLPQDAIDGGWTVQGIRGYAKRLEDQLKAALARVAELERGKVYVEARQCDECQHGGINDSATGVAACHECDWTGPEPEEDRCPGCQRENCMAAACPQCGARYVLVASEEIAAPVAQAQQLNDLDKQCRDDVARALGLRPNQERGFAWSYLLASIKSCVKASGDSAQAQHSVPRAWLDVQAERRRQVEAEGWTPEHDDEHSHGQMARAAACYALAGSSAPNDGTAALLVSLAWPWDEQWWKPSTARRDLVKACALALAEIERLDRATATQGGPRDA